MTLVSYLFLLCFVCLCICIFFSFYYPTLSLLCMFQSYNDLFSMDGHHLAFYMTEHNYSVFCNQKQGSTNANLSGNLYGATYFSSLASFARYLRMFAANI